MNLEIWRTTDLVPDFEETDDYVEWKKRFAKWQTSLDKAIQTKIDAADVVIVENVFGSFSSDELIKNAISLATKENWVEINPNFEQWSPRSLRNETTNADILYVVSNFIKDRLGSIVFKGPLPISHITKIVTTVEKNSFLHQISTMSHQNLSFVTLSYES